ncbi:MAG: hypothetical protein JWN86_1727 [Planctomycetota bacterium]|nr:hypothetical protein [Planctomycetota bacterium]
MLPGPVFNVELLTTARRPRYYAVRVLYGLALMVLVWQNYASWDRFGGEMFSPQQMTQFAKSTFESMVVLQGLMVLAMTPSLVAGVIANERQRKTLHYLLASQLTSAEIVLGKLMARMLHVAVFLAIGLPIMSLLSLFGGVDPLLVMLSVTSTFSMAFFLAALSVLCSTVSKRVREAISAAYALEAAWLVLPVLVRNLMPWQYPKLYSYVQPANDWLMASTPWAPLQWFFGPWRTPTAGPLLEIAFWMIGLQIGAGLALVAIAVWRLRPVFKAQEGARAFRFLGIPLSVGKSRRIRFLGRKPVGDNAIMWKEMHTSRTSGMAQVVGVLIALVILGAIGYWAYVYGYTAFQEMRVSKYDSSGPERQSFNAFLRIVTTSIGVICILAAAVGGANSLTSEREDDTWISLIATPLDGREIVWAKMVGVVWKLRWALSLLAVLWVVGMTCGSIHPVGAIFESVQLATFLAYATALGTFFSLKSRSTWRSQATTVAVLFAAGGGYMTCCCPMMFQGRPSMLFVAGCIPFLMAVSLLSPWDFSEYFINFGSSVGSRMQAETVEVIIASLIGTIGYATAAFFLAMATFSGFDRAAERPMRDVFGSPFPPVPVPPAKPKVPADLT